MRVLYFGTYERDYPRNAQVISCLRRAGVDVRERHEPVWDGRRSSWRAGVGDAARLALAEARLLRAPRERFDAVIVGYPGHFDLLTVSFIGRYRHRPLHLFGGLGLLTMLGGGACLLYLTVLKAQGHAIGSRPLLILGVLLVVVGIQLLSLGLIGEMITSLHEERADEQTRAQAVVDEVLTRGKQPVSPVGPLP